MSIPRPTTRWYLDTEFNEDGHTIDLISIALCSEDGRDYYAVSDEFDEARCNDWVKQHVLPIVGNHPRSSRKDIAADIRELVLRPVRGVATQVPEFWAYHADYDWVALCQLFGTMMDLPRGMPMYCNDLQQLVQMFRIADSDLPVQTEAVHNALADARWARDTHEFVIERIARLDPGQVVDFLR